MRIQGKVDGNNLTITSVTNIENDISNLIKQITDLSKSINNVVDCEVDNDINFEEIDKLSFKIENDFVELKKIIELN